MKWITHTIRFPKKASEQMSLLFPAPKPMNPHLDPIHNPYHDLETPEEKSFSATPPAISRGIGSGIRGARFHIDNEGVRTGVAKSDANSHLKEPLVYQLSKSFVPGLVPMTVARGHKDMHGSPYDKPIEPEEADIMNKNPLRKPRIPELFKGHSVQQVVRGDTLANTADSSDMQRSHPDFGKIAMFDYLIGNNDRHGYNTIASYSPHGPSQFDGYNLHAIDNGGAFSYDSDSMKDRIKDNLESHEGEIPSDFRQNVLNANPKQFQDLFARAQAHPRSARPEGYLAAQSHGENGWKAGNFSGGTPSEAYEGFRDNLDTMKRHLQDPEVRTVKDLHDRLYPSFDDDEDSNYDHEADAGIPEEEPGWNTNDSFRPSTDKSTHSF